MAELPELPELLATAIASAVTSGRRLSWKIQENQRGTLIQLVWKNDSAVAVGNTSVNAKVGINWSEASTHDSARTPSGGKSTQHKGVPPSRKRRNARRLQSFLLKKRRGVNIDCAVEHIITPPRPGGVHRARADDANIGDKLLERETCNLHCSARNTNVAVSDADEDVADLKAFIMNKVQCVDFCIDGGGPGLDLELTNSGTTIRKQVDVLKPDSQTLQMSYAMTVEELSHFDDVEFQLNADDDSPGVLLRKDGVVKWTPVANRTRSRVKHVN